MLMNNILLVSLAVALLASIIGFIFEPAWNNKKQNYSIFFNKMNIEDITQDIIPHAAIHDQQSIELSVVIPAYNEELRLKTMVDDAILYLDVWRKDVGVLYELVIVDDGSSDGTLGEMRRIQNTIEDIPVTLLKLHSNQGKGAAVRQGVLAAKGKYILMADADGATNMSDLAALLHEMKRIQTISPMSEGMVVGSRAHMTEKSVATREFYRTILMRAFHLVVYALCTRTVRDTQCGFKLFTRNTALKLFQNLHLERWAFDIELIYMAESLEIPIAEVGVTWREVEGSKLIKNKLDVVLTSIVMARDLLCNRLSYALGIWRLPAPT